MPLRTASATRTDRARIRTPFAARFLRRGFHACRRTKIEGRTGNRGPNRGTLRIEHAHRRIGPRRGSRQAARSLAARSSRFRFPGRLGDRSRPSCTHGFPTSRQAGTSCGRLESLPCRHCRLARRWRRRRTLRPGARPGSPRRPSCHARRRRAPAIGNIPSTRRGADRDATAKPARDPFHAARTSEVEAGARRPKSPHR